MPFADWLVFCLASEVGRILRGPRSEREEFAPGLTKQRRSGVSEFPTQKSCAQNTSVEIELLSKTDGQTGIIGRRYMIMSSLYLRTERALHAALRIPQYSAITAG
jgi:hypothetical protein